MRKPLAVALLASLACGGGVEAWENGMLMNGSANDRTEKPVVERIDSRGDC